MVSVVQLSDTHLFADPDGELYSVNTRQSLARVIQEVKQKIGNIDCILVTGDLVHDESEAGYVALGQLVSQLDSPAYYLPGNHDDLKIIQSHFENATVNGICVTQFGRWKIILLDSSNPGKVEGHLSPNLLSALEAELIESSDMHVLVAVHHHVINTQSEWIDKLNLTNNHEFRLMLQRFPQVRVVINGHIHQELDEFENNIRYLGVPSTCFQFKSKKARAEIDDSVCGFRYLELKDNGEFQTEVFYLEI